MAISIVTAGVSIDSGTSNIVNTPRFFCRQCSMSGEPFFEKAISSRRFAGANRVSGAIYMVAESRMQINLVGRELILMA